MAANLPSVMTRDEAIEEFEACPYGGLQSVIRAYEADGIPDWPARREAWNNFTDMLCKDRRISDWQYNNWSQPECCGD